MSDATAPRDVWTQLKLLNLAYFQATGEPAFRSIDYLYSFTGFDPERCLVHFGDGHISNGEVAAVKYLRRMCEVMGVPTGEPER
jgi:hypothetical protein